MKSTLRKFARHRYSANRICPCGKDNRNGRFATERGFEGRPVGHCHDCGEDFWNDEGTLVDVSRVDRQTVVNYCKFDWEDVSNTFDADLESTFAKFLISLFGEEITAAIAEKYFLGLWGNKVIFWQVDRKIQVRHGEIIEYNSGGSRQKHSSYRHEKKIECQLDQCLFGEHLLANNDRPVAVVEAPKTACIMSTIMTDYIWVATSSASNLKRKSKALIGRNVTLIPDQGQYEKWKSIGDENGFNTNDICEDWYKDGLIDEKDDILDYYLKNLSQYFGTVKIDPEWNDFVDENPELNLTKN